MVTLATLAVGYITSETLGILRKRSNIVYMLGRWKVELHSELYTRFKYIVVCIQYVVIAQ